METYCLYSAENAAAAATAAAPAETTAAPAVPAPAPAVTAYQAPQVQPSTELDVTQGPKLCAACCC